MSEPRVTTGLRWREDTGLEWRCGDCRTYWPLEREFWNFQTFTRCKACWSKYKNKRARELYRVSPEKRAKNRDYQRAYRRAAKKAKHIYQLDYYWKDPDVARKKAKDYYYAHREEVLARRREKYVPRGPRWTPEKRAEAAERTRQMRAEWSPEKLAAWRRSISEARKKAA